MICELCGKTLSGENVICTCKRREPFLKDKRFIVETKEPEKENTENEQTEIPDIEPNKRNYGTGKSFAKKDVFPD